MKAFLNAGLCGICGNVIISKYRHDFQACQCGNLYVDGGLDYQRYGWGEKEKGHSLIWDNSKDSWVSLKEIWKEEKLKGGTENEK